MSKHLALVDPVTGETETGDLEELLVWAFEEDPALLARVLQALHKARRPPSQPGVVQLLHALRGNFSHSTEEWWGEYRARLLRAVAAEAGPEVAALLPGPVVFGESTRRGRLPLTVADAPEEGQREAIERAAQLLEHPTPQAVGAALALLRAAAEGRAPAVRDEALRQEGRDQATAAIVAYLRRLREQKAVSPLASSAEARTLIQGAVLVLGDACDAIGQGKHLEGT